jgi:hypothetical protein
MALDCRPHPSVLLVLEPAPNHRSYRQAAKYRLRQRAAVHFMWVSNCPTNLSFDRQFNQDGGLTQLHYLPLLRRQVN